MRNVHVIGASNLDLRIKCKSKVCENSSLPSAIGLSAGGVGRNIAYNLSVMQVNTKITSIVPKNIFGEFIIENTNNKNLDISNIIRFEKENADFYCDIFDGYKNYKFNDMQSINQLDICHLPEDISEAKYIVIDLNISNKLINHLFNETKAPIICDATSAHKCVKILPFLNRILTLKCNLNEAIELARNLNSNIKTDNLLDISNEILEAGVKKVFITLGKDGAFLAEKNNKYKVNIKETKIVSAVGAGDTFTASIIYGLYNDLESIDVLTYAVKVSSCMALSGESILSNKVLEEAKIQDQMDFDIYIYS